MAGQWTTTGRGSWCYDIGSTTATNAEPPQQSCQHQSYDLAEPPLFRGRAYKTLQRVSDINRIRATGPPWPRLGRIIVLGVCSSRCGSVPGAVKGWTPLFGRSSEVAEFSFITVLTTPLRNAARRGFAALVLRPTNSRRSHSVRALALLA